MEQLTLLPDEESWEEEWNGMPEYSVEKELKPEVTATFKFKTFEDFEVFKKSIKENLYGGGKVFDGQQSKTEKNAWYPLKEKSSNYIYETEQSIHPQFPLFIVSKGRWKRNPTTRSLKEMGVDFRIICEREEYQNYSSLVEPEKIIVLPQKYKNEYDLFWKDDDPRTGPGPARNLAWDVSINEGYDFHWVLDDNIEAFEILNRNKKIKCLSGAFFKAQEDFVLKYENIAQAGPAYSFFVPASDARPAYKLNTRIYSCLLIRNDLDVRWRGRYNEDTDLSLRLLKDKWCTVQFNAFLQAKRATQTVKGGNTKEFYDKEGT